nr:hypothetical protein [Pedobacter sp. ASV2]
MVAQKLLEGNVLWSYDHELDTKTSWIKKIAGLFSFLPPLHHHEGAILLTNHSLSISGDEDLVLPLRDIEEVFIGFDELFPASSVKNFGAFWQPIRLKASPGMADVLTIYMVINYNGLFTANKDWFNALIRLLR